MLGMLFYLQSAVIFHHNFFENILSAVTSMSYSLDPDQDRHSVSPDLGPNCLQRLLTEDKSPG